MNQKIKDYVGISIILSLLIFALSATSYVVSYSRSFGPLSLPSFTVDGEGKVNATPDIGQFTATIITEGGLDVEKLQSDNSRKSNSVVSFLKSNGIEDNDIETSRYSVNPRYTYPNCEFGVECPPPKISGYNISQSVTVKVRNVDNAGFLLSGVVENGANSVSGLSFTIDDPVNLENKARAKAVSQAQAKAQALADASGFKLGKLLSIETVDYGYPSFSRSESLAAYDIGGGVPSIEPGSEDVISRVILTYEIK